MLEILSAYDSPERVCARVPVHKYVDTLRAKTRVSEPLMLESQVVISYLTWAPGTELRPSA